ncbi:MAG: neuraminidase-like domain-containing protein [Chloroflexota bacterium]|nr:neuraminidase-like domain-containing protein [Chloroflexota bacterium]
MNNAQLPLAINFSGEDVATLHADLAQLNITIPDGELREKTFGVGTQGAIRQLQAAAGLPHTGIVDAATQIAISSARGDAADPRHSVAGRIMVDRGDPAGAITVKLYRRDFGGAETPLGEMLTDAQGFYSLPYDGAEGSNNLELRFVDKDGQEKPLSATKFGAARHEVMNLIAPAASLPPLAISEYERMKTTIEPLVGDDIANLKNARETRDTTRADFRQDITFLHQESKWDARLIGLNATAQQLAGDAEINPRLATMGAAALYGMARVGLPTDPNQLALVKPAAVENGLTVAAERNIVAMTPDEIKEAVASFTAFANGRFLETAPQGTLATPNAMLRISSLSAEKQTAFAGIFARHTGSNAELFQQASDEGFTAAEVQAIQTRGKLAYLTLSNVKLIESLPVPTATPDDLSQLVDTGFYKEATWRAQLDAIAGEDLNSVIPATYAGETAVRRDAYAADLARKVRVAYPTAVVGQMLVDDDVASRLVVPGVLDPARTAKLLKISDRLEFRLGRQSFESFVSSRRVELLEAGLTEAELDTAGDDIKAMQRLAQLSPSNEALKALADLGFTAAADIVAIPHAEFLARYRASFASPQIADLVYRKAEQVTAVVRNIFPIAQHLATAPVVAAIPDHRESARGTLLATFPTLTQLFGNLDFCECEHCRSVFSPAAYFVDLLKFLEPDDATWQRFLADWRDKYGGSPYPYETTDQQTAFAAAWQAKHPDRPVPAPERKPYDVLTQDRRPDLPHLALSCENTLTALPYIDVVNEIQEYHVAHGALDAGASHDTGEVTSPELLAEPHHVEPLAYAKLQTARYPLALPFDLWLETVRRMFDHFDTPLWRAMTLFRPSDDLFLPTPPPVDDYGWFDIFRESLGLTPVMADLLTHRTPLTTWFELYGFADEATALTALRASAKTIANRLGVSYQELADLIATWFINPGLDALVTLRTLGLVLDDVIRYKTGGLNPSETLTVEARLDDATKRYTAAVFNSREWLDERWSEGAFDAALILDSPPGCSFDMTTLRLAGGDDPAASAWVFHKLNVFTRLWRALGWSMTETDRALRTFLATDGQPLTADNLGAAMETALVYLSHLKALTARVSVGDDARLKLLTLWSRLPATGRQPLYGQLFLTRNVLNDDPAFDHPFGDYLADPSILLRDHLPTLQDALQLTAVEIDLILRDAGQALDAVVTSDGTVTIPAAGLTQDAVALLYRHGLLARGLGLTVEELLTLKALSGLDPFMPLAPAPLTSLAEDHPWQHTLAFVDLLDGIETTGFAVTDLDYLLRHRFDPVGPHRDDPAALLGLVQTLAAGLRQVDAAHAVPSDAEMITDDLLRQALSQLLAPDVVETFLRMWTGTEEYVAKQADVAPEAALKPADFAQTTSIRLDASSYDPVTQTQRLAYRGVLADQTKADLLTRHEARQAVLDPLLTAIQTQAREFFAKHLAGFFAEPNAFELLFAPVDSLSGHTAMLANRARLAHAFLPAVRALLARRLVVEALASALDADPLLTETLLVDPSLVTVPATNDNLLTAFMDVSARGVSAWYASEPNAQPAAMLAADPAPTTDTAAITIPDPAAPLGHSHPATINSAHFSGYFEVAERGDYVFLAAAPAVGATVELRLADSPLPIIRETVTDPTNLTFNAEVPDLKPGVPYAFTFTATNLSNGAASLQARGGKLPLDALSQLTLYPAQSVERAGRARTLLAKALQLIQQLALTERELRYLAATGYRRPDGTIDDSVKLNLSGLPTARSSDPAAGVVPFNWFTRLARYVALRAAIADGSEALIDIFERARLARSAHPGLDLAAIDALMLDDVATRVAELTRREPDAVRATLATLGVSVTRQADGFDEMTGLADERGLGQIWEVLQAEQGFGVPAAALKRWARPRPDNLITADLRRTLKARYGSAAWQRIAPSIFDPLRQRQRDALVAYLLTDLGFDRMEQLYEYFLIDPGMEPVVQTSRIRLAIASIQLFVQRCLLNLELQVRPSAINSKHWQWMKRYRVWEANRKIFVYPENWLEPEFRDDKTHLFQELEGALLASDVADDLVESAFFAYLRQLEEIAKLEMVTMYIDEFDDVAQTTIHVVGRTPRQPHKYFYRRFSYGTWTPWEPITAEIEGDHVAAVMWRSRLHLFWVTFVPKPKKTGGGVPAKDAEGAVASRTLSSVSADVVGALRHELDIWLNWSELFQGEWSSREAAVTAAGAPYAPEVMPNFDSRHISIHVERVMRGEREGPVQIHLSGSAPDNGGSVNVVFEVANKNAPPRRHVGAAKAPPTPPFVFNNETPIRNDGNGSFAVNFAERTEFDADGNVINAADTAPRPQTIFGTSQPFAIVSPSHSLQRGDDPVVNALISPFFYFDDQAVFFGLPAVAEETFKVWDGFVPIWDQPDFVWDRPAWLDQVKGLIVEQVPDPRIGPYPFEVFDPATIYPVRQGLDLVVNNATVVRFDEGLLGQAGDIGLFEVSAADLVGTFRSGARVNAIALNPGSQVAAESVVIAANPEAVVNGPAGTFRGMNATMPFRSINVIGGAGINGALLTNVNAIRLSPNATIGNIRAIDDLNDIGGIFNP